MGTEGDVQFRDVFMQRFSVVKKSEHHVDFDGFLVLMTEMKEHAKAMRSEREQQLVSAESLTQTDVENHRDELLAMHDCFLRHAKESRRHLVEPEVVCALLESGLMPLEGEARRRVQMLVHGECIRASSEGVGFACFLKTIRSIREETKRIKLPEYRERFSRYDADRNGELSLAETSVLFSEIGLIPRCQQDQDEMKMIFDEVDHNGSGSLDFSEFQDLVQRVTEKLRSSQRRRENETGRQLGYSAHQMSELRESFFNLDTEGYGELTIDQCRTTLLMMKKSMSGTDLNEVFNEIDRNSNNRIDFVGFLYFVKVLENRSFDLKAALDKLPRI